MKRKAKAIECKIPNRTNTYRYCKEVHILHAKKEIGDVACHKEFVLRLCNLLPCFLVASVFLSCVTMKFSLAWVPGSAFPAPDAYSDWSGQS